MRNLIVVLLVMVVGSAQAASSKKKWSWFIEQDLFALDSLTGLNEDRDYTMGLGISHYESARDRGGKKSVPLFLGKKSKFLKNEVGSAHNYFDFNSSKFQFGVTAFTPEDFVSFEPVEGDRPFANLIYVARSEIYPYFSYNEENGAVDQISRSSKFVIGHLGSNIGDAVQNGIHDLTDGKPSNGWHNQISDGGELTFLWGLEQRNLLRHRYTKGKSYDMYLSRGFNVGYYTNLYAGIDVRRGRISTPYYAHHSFDNDAGTQLIEVDTYESFRSGLHGLMHGDGEQSNQQLDVKRKSVVEYSPIPERDVKESYWSAGVRLYGVVYNELLQGGFRDTAYTIDSSEMKRGVVEASIGYAKEFKRFKLGYNFQFRSPTFSGSEERDHYFGAVSFSSVSRE